MCSSTSLSTGILGSISIKLWTWLLLVAVVVVFEKDPVLI